ncbi:MAG: conditioned medium-induced protein 4 [Haloarculaceae archaeon]
MDEKTAELRDIFLSVSEEEAVTERQTETPGSLLDDGGDDTEQLREVVTRLRERESCETDLDVETYVALVRAFYDDADDEAIAADLDLAPETVLAARLDLHLLREADTDAPFDLAALRRRADEADETVAADLGVDVETVAHYRRIAAAQDAARRANHRYQEAFDEILTDADLARRFADTEDGLEEAAEDIETDVSF